MVVARHVFMCPREGRGPERPGPDYPAEWDQEPDEPFPTDVDPYQ